MSHFHLKYFPRTGQPTANLHSVFFSGIDALNAAGLANATRGKESGYYGVEECQFRACEGPRKKVAAPRFKGPTGAPRTRVSPRFPGW